MRGLAHYALAGTVALATLVAASAWAQGDGQAIDKEAEKRRIQAGEGQETGAPPSILAEAIALCEATLADWDAAPRLLEAGDWRVFAAESDDPYLVDLVANRFVEDVGDAEIYAARERYPGLGIAYCTLSVNMPFEAVDIADLGRLVGGVDLEQSGGEDGVYAAYRDGDRVGRVASTTDEFVVQLTLVEQR